MEKIKIFTNHYAPENFRVNELSQEMANSFKVEVITQTPNYPKGDFYKGYSWFKRNKDVIGKVKVKRLPVIPRKSSSLTLMLNYFSYAVSSFFYSVFTKDTADHVFVYVTSPIFISWAGLRFAKRNKIKSTLYLLDLWPGSLISILNLENKYLINILEKICIKIYKRFDTIAVSSRGFVEVLGNYGLDTSKIYYIPQHSEEGKKKIINPETPMGTLKVVFTGNIGEAQGLDILIETAKKLTEKDFDKVHFTIVGDGRYRKTLEEHIKEQGVVDYFTFTGFVDPSEISKILAENHFGFVSLQDQEIFNRTLPAKVQSYMADGIPIIASANGEVPQLIRESSCGYSVEAGDSNGLSELIMDIQKINTSILVKISKNSYNYSIKHFNKETIVKQFIQIMKEGR